jgi:hypothetical protein
MDAAEYVLSEEDRLALADLALDQPSPCLLLFASACAAAGLTMAALSSHFLAQAVSLCAVLPCVCLQDDGCCRVCALRRGQASPS